MIPADLGTPALLQALYTDGLVWRLIEVRERCATWGAIATSPLCCPICHVARAFFVVRERFVLTPACRWSVACVACDVHGQTETQPDPHPKTTEAV